MANYSKHPAGIASDAVLWFGPEVENDRKGTWTAFVAGRLNGEQVGRVEREADHVFLLERFQDFRWFEDHLANRILRKPVTLARIAHPTAVEAAVRWRNGLVAPRVRIVVRLEAGWMSHLRGDDEVSVGRSYSLWTWRVDDAVHARPRDYRADEP